MSVIERTFGKLYGLPCWGVNYEPLLNLSMSFGDPKMYVRESRDPKTWFYDRPVPTGVHRRTITVKGQWWLWIYYARWGISDRGERLATSSSSLARQTKAVRWLDGQKLLKVEVNSQTATSRFTFDLGATLDVRRRDKDGDSDLWVLYKPYGYILSVRPDGTYDHIRCGLQGEQWGIVRRPLVES